MRLAALAVLITLGGCFGGPPEVKYYSLRSDKLVTEKAGPQDAPVALLDRFTIDDAYTDDRVAYRSGSHELGFDPYARWAGPPASQVEDAVRDLLRAAGIFSALRQPQPIGEGRSGYDLIVTGRVARLEEVDLEDDTLGALDLELFLLDGRTRAVLYRTHFARQEKAEKRNPREVCAAISRLLEQAVGEFAQGVKPIAAGRKPSR